MDDTFRVLMENSGEFSMDDDGFDDIEEGSENSECSKEIRR
jgi:hypothetical protein